MTNQLSIHKLLALVVTGASVLMTPDARVASAEDYLPFVGPPPLRFMISPPTGDVPVKPLLPPAAAPTNAPTMPTPMAPVDTNTAPVAAFTNAAAPLSLHNPPAHSEAETLQPELTLPASELFTISPEMLLDYFKPVGIGTNGARGTIYAPVKVGFTPPVSSAPGKSSATYQIK